MFLLPAAVVIIAFRIVPMFYGVYYSLTNWDGIGAPRYVGFANFVRAFHDPVVLLAFKNNLYLLATLPIWILLPMAIAVLVYEGMLLGRIIRFALVIPTLLSPAIIGLYYSLVLMQGGPFNELLGAMHLTSLEHQWLADPSTVLPTFLVIGLWSGLGVGTLFFNAGLASMDDSLLEAATLDGATRLQRIRWVVVPHLRPVTAFYGVYSFIVFFAGMLPLLFTLTGGGPGHASTTVDLYVYQAAFENSQVGYASALGIIVLLLCACAAPVMIWLFSRSEDGQARS